MGGLDAGGESRSRAKKGTKKYKKGRVGVRIDMTPMVDVAFLLLTFFMLTTQFAKSQTMEINLPPDEQVTVEVAESNLLVLLVASDGSIYWNIGTNAPQKIDFNSIRPLLLERSQGNPRLITLIKVDRNSTYSMMVDIMDELNLADITRFTLAPMLPKDLESIAKVAGI